MPTSLQDFLSSHAAINSPTAYAAQRIAIELERQQQKLLKPTCTLREYAREFWIIVEPAAQFVDSWHIGAICEHLDAVLAGQIQNLIINIPPRHSKSLLASVFWCTHSWTYKPWLRWLHSSYAQPLSTRDSLKSRRLIESPQYQRQWGDVFQLTGDQNQKTRFENDKTGYRLATSVGGSNTGEGGDIICVRGDTLIQTDCGLIEICKIVNEQLPVRVLGSTGFQRIKKYEKSNGRPLVEIETETGKVLRCTENHPIFIQDIGFVNAGDLDLYADLFVREMRSECLSNAPRNEERESWDLLLQEMFSGFCKDSESSGLAIETVLALSTLRRSLQVQDEILFESLLPYRVQREEVTRENRCLPSMQEDVLAATLQSAILFENLRRQSSSYSSEGRRQRSLHNGQVGDSVYNRLHETVEARNSTSGSVPLRRLPEALWAWSSPCRRNEDQPRSEEFGNALWLLSPQGAQQLANRSQGYEVVRIKDIHRCETPDYVYNLNVVPDHDYYANGILTHNCIDDPMDIRLRHSTNAREKVLEWWDSVMSNRLNNQKTGHKVIIMQRLHEEDLSGHALKGGGYEHLRLPAEFNPAKRCVTSIGWKDPRVDKGELLCPDRFGPKEILEIGKPLGIAGKSAILNQEPITESGSLFDPKNWKIVEALPQEGLVRSTRYWDCAGTEDDGDFTAGLKMNMYRDGTFIIVDMKRGQWSTFDVDKMIKLTAQLDGQRVRIREEQEPGSAGKAVINSRRISLAGYDYEGYPSTGDKTTRAKPLSIQQEAGNIKILKADWNDELIDEYKVFPFGGFDDQVDAGSGAFTDLTLGRRRPRIGAW